MNHICNYLLTSYYINDCNVKMMGELFIFKLNKMNMKKMIPTLRTLRINQSRYAFDIIAFFGESDSIINHACRKKLARHIPSAKIVTLKKGHNLLDEELFNTIVELL